MLFGGVTKQDQTSQTKKPWDSGTLDCGMRIEDCGFGEKSRGTVGHGFAQDSQRHLFRHFGESMLDFK